MPRVLRIVCSGSVKLTLMLGDDRLSQDSQVASVLAEPGDYPLVWVASGPAGAAYSVALLEPTESGFHFAGVLNDSGRDAGLRWLSL